MISAFPPKGQRSVGSMRNLLSVLDGDLADGRTTLAAASCDIERAASYCGENYLKGQKDGKLENTMAFATQSLGTVAYQISRLASHFLEAIDMQSDMLGEISDRIEKLRMVCNIHQEKVSRKAIGSCTNPKVPIVFQHEYSHSEPPQKYVRRPIDYSLLDTVGHGVRTQEPVLNQYGVPVLHSNTIQRRTSASTSVPMQGAFVRQHSTVSCRTSATKSTIEYAAPMHSSNTMRYQSGTLGRTAGIYRTAVVPPQHLLGSDALHAHSSGGGSSPAAGSLSSSNYALGGAVVATNLTGTDVVNAPTLVGQSSRSSGSSSLGSSAQHAMVSPTQMTHQGHGFAHQQQQSTYCQPITGTHNPVGQGTQSKVTYSTSDGSTTAAVQLRQQHLQTAQNLQSNPVPTQHNMHPQGYQTVHAQATEYTANQQQYAQQKQLQLHQQAQTTMHAMQSTGIPHNLIPMDPPLHIVGNVQNYAKPAEQNAVTIPPTSLLPSDNIPVPPPEAYAGPAPSTPNHAYLGAEVPPLTADTHEIGDIPGLSAPTGLIARRPEDPAWAPDHYMEKVITMYEYVRDKDDELTFTENQIIYVIKKNDDGWWEGVMNGITGLFPGNYVELYD